MKKTVFVWMVWLVGCAANVDAPADSREVDGDQQTLHVAAREGAVFTQSNEANGNRVYAFARDAQGNLDEPAAYATGGLGSGDSLGSQGALTLTSDGRFLLAVNAGSNDVSSFAVRGNTLELRDRVASGGTRPISVDEGRGLVYVLNAGGDANNVSGFYLDLHGRLHPLARATQRLSAAQVGPAQVMLDPYALTLVVSEKATNNLDVFRVGVFGALSTAQVQPDAGTTPFGFDISREGTLVISEAASASMSSYRVRLGSLDLVSAAVPDTQAAPCWVAIAPDGDFAYTANAGSQSISSYRLAHGGAITLQEARAGEVGPGAAPLDLAFASRGRFLYVLDRGNADVAAFAVARDGALEPMNAAGELAPFATGLAAY